MHHKTVPTVSNHCIYKLDQFLNTKVINKMNIARVLSVIFNLPLVNWKHHLAAHERCRDLFIGFVNDNVLDLVLTNSDDIIPNTAGEMLVREI